MRGEFLSFPHKKPPTPAAMIIQIGENPNNQINEADTTGIHKLYRLILADRPIVKVGAAISATTAGRIPLNIRSTIGLSLKVWKKRAMAK